MGTFIGGLHDRGMDYITDRSAEAIAECTGVDVSTARRWKSGASRVPESARRLLSNDVGVLPDAGPLWRGWKVRGNEIVSPEGWCFSAGDVLSLPLMRQQIAHYQAELRRLKGLEAQPEPGEVHEYPGRLRQTGG